MSYGIRRGTAEEDGAEGIVLQGSFKVSGLCSHTEHRNSGKQTVETPRKGTGCISPRIDRNEVRSNMDIHYRHEVKHYLNWCDLIAIRSRLRAVMEPDPHAQDGKYAIRSLYFDNPQDKALREKIDGVNMREKFRIRYYNADTSFIHLEKKSKHNSLGTKYDAPLSAEEAQQIVDGDVDWMLHSDQPLIKELYVKMRYQGLRPKTIVDYTRVLCSEET